MSILDVIKNEKQRNTLLKGMNDKVFILDENLKKLIFMITPYMGTGVHPVDLFKHEFSLDVGEIPSFGDCLTLCETNYNGIIKDYSDIYGEEPTEFKNGIRGLFDGNRLSDHIAEDRRLTIGEMLIEGSKGTKVQVTKAQGARYRSER